MHTGKGPGKFVGGGVVPPVSMVHVATATG